MRILASIDTGSIFIEDIMISSKVKINIYKGDFIALRFEGSCLVYGIFEEKGEIK